MSKLSFPLTWKRGLEQRPTDFSTTVSTPASWPEYDPPVWTYDLNVKSRGVPLTDHLVVEIRSENEQTKPITRVAVHL